MPQLFRPPRPLPAALEPSPPLDPSSMPSPPPPPAPAPPLASEDEERPRAPMKKMSQLLSYFVNHVFGGMDRGWRMAMIGLHAWICVVKIVSFCIDPEVASFWIPIFRVLVWVCFAAMVLFTCVDIRFDPPAAGAVQLPSPPPEMDMC